MVGQLVFSHAHTVVSIGHFSNKTRKTRQDKTGQTKRRKVKMVFLRSLIGLCLLMLMMVSPIESTRQAQYGLESIDGYCEGWGEIDQLADISSQVLSSKYPYMGPIRVS